MHIGDYKGPYKLMRDRPKAIRNKVSCPYSCTFQDVLYTVDLSHDDVRERFSQRVFALKEMHQKLWEEVIKGAGVDENFFHYLRNTGKRKLTPLIVRDTATTLRTTPGILLLQQSILEDGFKEL